MKAVLRLTVLSTILALTACFDFLNSEPTFQRTLDNASIRVTTAGSVVGVADQASTYAWLGIPYASAPQGEWRWKAPQPVAPWQGNHEATQFGNVCPQYWSMLAGVDGEEGDIVGAEDCLYLNVWAPQHIEDDEKLPVMFWLHGGGNTIGASNTFDGSFLAGEQRVIVVTINYRLGVLGWLSHAGLREAADNPEDASGNFALLDSIAALIWVQNNIGSFGGDAGRVTIFGESSGGHNVFALMGSPLAKGLFHRAIAQSGAYRSTPVEIAEGYTDAEQPGMANSSNELLLEWLPEAANSSSRAEARQLVANRSASEQLQFIKSLSVESLLKPMAGSPFGMYQVPVLIRDGHVLPRQSLYQLFKHPNQFNAVPLITGTTRDETKIFMAADPRWVKNKLGFLPRIKNPEQYHRFASLLSDQWKAMSVDEVAKVLTANDIPVYTYRFDWDNIMSNWLIDLPELMGAGHGFEISFVFGNFDDPLARVIPGMTTSKNKAGREYVSDHMMSYWAEFAYSGRPGTGRGGQQTEWSSYAPGDTSLMVFDEPDDSGVRLEQADLSVSALKQQLAGDAVFTKRKERCQLYALLFYGNVFHANDFWDADEYRDFSDKGCAGYAPQALIEEYIDAVE